jgi:hypothetical protein
MKPTSPPTRPGTGKSTPGDASRRQQRIAWAAALLLLLFGIWLIWPASEVARVRQLHLEFAAAEANLTEEERAQRKRELHDLEKKLSRAEREALKNDLKKAKDGHKNSREASYLVLSPAERQQVIRELLAKDIAKERKDAEKAKWDALKKAAKGQGGGKGDGKAGAKGPKDKADQPKGPKVEPTAEQKDVKDRQKLLETTPQARAGKDQMKLDLMTARIRAGLPPEPPKKPKVVKGP